MHDLLTKNAAVYINSDSNGRGFLYVGGSHTLEKFINEVARDVTDPEKKISVFERARALQLVRESPERRREAREQTDLEISALGSGSDYTPFLQHLGIASLNLGYGGEGGGGSYHSIYDSFDHYARFVDPSFEYGVTLAQTAGRAVLRFANADVLPFEFSNFSHRVGKYILELTKLADDLRTETEEKNRQIRDKTLEAVLDPTQPYVIPQPREPVPYLNFSPLQNSFTQLQDKEKEYRDAVSALTSKGQTLPREVQMSLDEVLMKTERALTRSDGLPRRSWFKHQIYAPGFYTGYDVKTLPAVREAIEERNWKDVDEQVAIVAKTIDRFTDEIDRATKLVKQSSRD